MNKFQEKQIQEALERMKFLQLHENVITDFMTKRRLNSSEGKGFIYWLDESQESIVKKWEEETGNLVYHVIKNKTTFGDLLSFLYISKEEEEWEYDREDLKSNIALSYVMNLTDDYCSEYGSIGIKQNIGGLIRIA